MSLAGAAVALLAVGTVVQTAGAIQSGNAANKIAGYQAQVAHNQAIIDEQNAIYALQAGDQDAATKSMEGAAAVGSIRAAQAASGIDVNTGSAVDVQASERIRSALDTETVRHNAQLRAYGYRSQAMADEAEAGLRRAEGAQAKKAGQIKGLGTLLSGASSVAGMWSMGGGAGGGTSASGGMSNPEYNYFGYEG